MSNVAYRGVLASQVRAGVSEAVGSASQCAIVMYRDSPNVGDAAIWRAQEQVLSSLGVEIGYVAAGRHFRPETLRRCVADGPILISGGGSLGTTWPNSHAFKERVISEFPDRRVVILPQSANFDSDDALSEFSDVVASHPDVTIMARDTPTLERLQGLGCTLSLVPDMVFALEHPLLDVDRSPREGPRRLLWLLREDAEAPGNTIDPVEGERHDWADARIIRLAHELDVRLDKTRIPALRRTRLASWKAARRVDDGLRMLSDYDMVVTDRLHGALLSFLMGLPCVVLDNSWGKVHRFCRTWFETTDSITLATDVREVDEVLARS